MLFFTISIFSLTYDFSTVDSKDFTSVKIELIIFNKDIFIGNRILITYKREKMTERLTFKSQMADYVYEQ